MLLFPAAADNGQHGSCNTSTVSSMALVRGVMVPITSRADRYSLLTGKRGQPSKEETTLIPADALIRVISSLGRVEVALRLPPSPPPPTAGQE